ncbi:hypothetical protein RSOL_522600 [Rhizoctonia solani AG-3 Rhs1AP]|uniref:Uncharacterized protein n=2 Tax=Rhizoctonia solani AG-3 TaxID=1086053 RepID=A0A074RMT9_9AGAM|nr:hypothetical protein RSOL_522600 [Rhizoctonia solani AG-3 Rhs1AP]KEP46665.1 hypothetical protein V565_186990 [Rhizoctonia solani 123E]
MCIFAPSLQHMIHYRDRPRESGHFRLGVGLHASVHPFARLGISTLRSVTIFRAILRSMFVYSVAKNDSGSEFNGGLSILFTHPTSYTNTVARLLAGYYARPTELIHALVEATLGYLIYDFSTMLICLSYTSRSLSVLRVNA